MPFLTELRQRGVLRVAAWYAAAAWVLIQVASTVFPQFDLPAWSIRAVIIAAVIGLPVALLMAWTFEVTPAGVRRAVDADGVAVAAPRAPLWRIPSLWLALAAGVLLAVGAQQAWQRLVRPSFGERQLGQFDLQPRWVAVSLPWVLLRDDARVQQIIRDALPR